MRTLSNKAGQVITFHKHFIGVNGNVKDRVAVTYHVLSHRETPVIEIYAKEYGRDLDRALSGIVTVRNDSNLMEEITLHSCCEFTPSHELYAELLAHIEGGFGAKAKAAKQLPRLTGSFMRGTFEGQVNSIYKTLKAGENQEKVQAFIDAMHNKEIAVPAEIPAKLQAKLDEIKASSVN